MWPARPAGIQVGRRPHERNTPGSPTRGEQHGVHGEERRQASARTSPAGRPSPGRLKVAPASLETSTPRPVADHQRRPGPLEPVTGVPVERRGPERLARRRAT